MEGADGSGWRRRGLELGAVLSSPGRGAPCILRPALPSLLLSSLWLGGGPAGSERWWRELQ